MKLKALINLSDIVFFIFLTLTFLLIIVGSGKTENFQFLISIRIISAIIAILLIYFNDISLLLAISLCFSSLDTAKVSPLYLSQLCGINKNES